MISLRDKFDREFTLAPDMISDIRAYADTSVGFPLTRIVVATHAVFLARGSAPQILDAVNAMRTAAPLTLGPFLVAPARSEIPVRPTRRYFRPLTTPTPHEEYL